MAAAAVGVGGLTVAVKFAVEPATAAAAAAAAEGAEEEGDGVDMTLLASSRLARGTACDAVCPARHTHRSLGNSPRVYHASSCAGGPRTHTVRL